MTVILAFVVGAVVGAVVAWFVIRKNPRLGP